MIIKGRIRMITPNDLYPKLNSFKFRKKVARFLTNEYNRLYKQPIISKFIFSEAIGTSNDIFTSQPINNLYGDVILSNDEVSIKDFIIALFDIHRRFKHLIDNKYKYLKEHLNLTDNYQIEHYHLILEDKGNISPLLPKLQMTNHIFAEFSFKHTQYFNLAYHKAFNSDNDVITVSQYKDISYETTGLITNDNIDELVDVINVIADNEIPSLYFLKHIDVYPYRRKDYYLIKDLEDKKSLLFVDNGNIGYGFKYIPYLYTSIGKISTLDNEHALVEYSFDNPDTYKFIKVDN